MADGLIRLPAISLHQPYASAVMSGLKTHETRHWPSPARLIGQRVAIHAAKKPMPRSLRPAIREALIGEFGYETWRDLPFGKIVGTAVLASSQQMGPDGAQPADEIDELFGYWTPGRWAWRLVDKRPLLKPIPAVGRQGWFSVELPAELLNSSTGTAG